MKIKDIRHQLGWMFLVVVIFSLLFLFLLYFKWVIWRIRCGRKQRKPSSQSYCSYLGASASTRFHRGGLCSHDAVLRKEEAETVVCQTSLIICAWHGIYFPEEVPVGKILVFRRKSRRKLRTISVPDNDKIKQRAMSHGICGHCSRRFMQDNIGDFVKHEINTIRRHIRRR